MASSNYPDIWEISDDDDDDRRPLQSSLPSSSQLNGNTGGDEVVLITDTDSDDDEPPPSSQIPSSSQPRPSSPLTIDLTRSDDEERYSDDDRDDLPTFRATASDDDDSDSDLPPPELLSQSRKRRLSQSTSTDANGSPSKKSKSQSSSPIKMPLASASSSPDKAQTKPKRKRRTSQERRDEEREKEARRAQKERERELKKAAQLAAKEQKKQEKIEAAALLAQKKAEAAAMKDANKLQNNKREMYAHPELLPSLKERLRGLGGTLLFGRQLLRDHHTIQWKMRSNKRYNVETRNWIPCEEYEDLQSTALLYITGANLVHLVRTKTLVQTVKDFRNAHGNQSRHHQTFIMVERLEKERQRNDVHEALASLNITCHTHHVFVESVEEAVERLYNITADIGIKPYKLIERSHLPFCADFKQVETGKTFKETWNRMLCQIPGVTFSSAQGIVHEYPTVSSLFREYAENPAAGELLLQDCVVRARVDGVQNARRLNKALSTRVHAVMCGEDELALVARGA
ncbi:uncharacterized protein EV420DRAFT_1763201 [Desarmillaria tabescens]|uniref:ERCC4 domain-containing protein n=1 Tax=Armillaria tabescens TaxID=1929756 RepID=A0AA39KE47_ARMTA|nr:uncharacterized protein EV420DRAFT_1763201 [Desarmillaria tabescens]KAK0459486.1 hypothetical protein EV420DRAFT_1763201 [Desarmillaria tabescens]